MCDLSSFRLERCFIRSLLGYDPCGMGADDALTVARLHDCRCIHVVLLSLCCLTGIASVRRQYCKSPFSLTGNDLSASAEQLVPWLSSATTMQLVHWLPSDASVNSMGCCYVSPSVWCIILFKALTALSKSLLQHCDPVTIALQPGGPHVICSCCRAIAPTCCITFTPASCNE